MYDRSRIKNKNEKAIAAFSFNKYNQPYHQQSLPSQLYKNFAFATGKSKPYNIAG
jgi:hypothetical protein